MLGSIFGVALAIISMGWWHDNTRLGRPIATAAPYPAGMADDVHRPGFNGRLWVSRPIIGGMQGPYATEQGLLAERYGAFGDDDSTVYARVGGLAIGINAFEALSQNGLRGLENARNFWLKEQGYVGGVRTFVNDAYIWRKPDGEPRVQSNATPEPLATIKIPEDMPRRKNRLRVDASDKASAAAIVYLADGTARISWPQNAPADIVARSASKGHVIVLGRGSSSVIAAAR